MVLNTWHFLFKCSLLHVSKEIGLPLFLFVCGAAFAEIYDGHLTLIYSITLPGMLLAFTNDSSRHHSASLIDCISDTPHQGHTHLHSQTKCLDYIELCQVQQAIQHVAGHHDKVMCHQR